MRRNRWDVYELHVATITRFVARRVEPDAVDDVVAETFAIAWRRLPRGVKAPDWVLPWLYGVAKRVIHNHHRSHTRRSKLLARVSGDRELPNAPDSADLIVGDGQLARAFATLTTREREAIALVAWEHLSSSDAARVAGCSEATFAVRYSRARTRLSAALAVTGLDAEADADAAAGHPTVSGDPSLGGRRRSRRGPRRAAVGSPPVPSAPIRTGAEAMDFDLTTSSA